MDRKTKFWLTLSDLVSNIEDAIKSPTQEQEWVWAGGEPTPTLEPGVKWQYKTPGGMTVKFLEPKATPTPAALPTPRLEAAQGVAPKEMLDYMRQAGEKYNVNPSLLMDVAFSESSFDPNKQPYWYKTDTGKIDGQIIQTSVAKPKEPGWFYTTASGLYSFTDPTWTHSASKEYIKSGTSKYDYEAQIDAAAQWIRDKYLSKWGESKGKWGSKYTEEELAPYYFNK